MCDISNGYIQAEGIRCYGITNNRLVRNHNKDATITEEDKLNIIDAQSILDSI